MTWKNRAQPLPNARSLIDSRILAVLPQGGLQASAGPAILLALPLLLIGCGTDGSSSAAADPTCHVSATAVPLSIEEVDSLTKDSVEDDRVVMGALLRTSGFSSSDCSEPALYPASIEVRAAWVPNTQPGGLDASQDLCAGTYDPPEVKVLDPLHPDAIQPAIGAPDRWEGDVEGWVSWQAETRSDCEVETHASLTLEPRVFGNEPYEFELREAWTYSGPQAAAALAEPWPVRIASRTVAMKPVGVNRVRETQLASADGVSTQSPFNDDTVRVGRLTVPPDGEVTLELNVAHRSGPGCEFKVIAEAMDGATTHVLATHVDNGDWDATQTIASHAGDSTLEPGNEYDLLADTTCDVWAALVTHRVALADSTLVYLTEPPRGTPTTSFVVPDSGYLYLRWSAAPGPTECSLSIAARSEEETVRLLDKLISEETSDSRELSVDAPVYPLRSLASGETYDLTVQSFCERWNVEVVSASPVDA